ncbi:sugar transferase [Halocynthiibacter sp. C4]|uniref:sugar transferase n=1 Tax=Halocynthiibacter sp. C4 TaxID=2992758 RepID=UPI00237C2134|nr:sugar transferase [Halocynthiibacter sp. C4]MDE0590920.1 sugar transferase [Halocynthiibacter sp. C4]
MKDVSFDAEMNNLSVCYEFPAPRSGGFYQKRFKRLFDLIMVVFLLPIVAPLVFLFWLLIQFGGGKGIYRQDRVGRGGKPFSCLKLRTMVCNAEQTLEDLCKNDAQIAAEWAKNQKLANDPRITKLGRFLRATSLDELPQIWNVLKGDMSFVGPRPIMTGQNQAYKAAGGRAYYTMRPGITGLWQVLGRGTTSFADRAAFDEIYSERISFVGDLKLILNTVNVIFEQTGH